MEVSPFSYILMKYCLIDSFHSNPLKHVQKIYFIQTYA